MVEEIIGLTPASFRDAAHETDLRDLFCRVSVKRKDRAQPLAKN